MSKGTVNQVTPSWILANFELYLKMRNAINGTKVIARARASRASNKQARIERSRYTVLNRQDARLTSLTASAQPRTRKLSKWEESGLARPLPQRLQNPKFARPGDPNYVPPGSPTPKNRPPRKPSPKSQNIKTSAREAAEWLAVHWPDDVAEMGHDAFVAARYAEILAHDFNPDYWAECNQIAELAEVSIPSSILHPDQQPPPNGDPARLRSLTTYAASGDPYPNPGLGAGLPAPTPGYKGTTIGGRFRDLYLSADVKDFELVFETKGEEFRPLFSSCTATYHVTATKRPTRIQYSTHTRAVQYHVDNAAHNDNTVFHEVSRFLLWTNSLPPDAPPGYDQTMQRHYLVDLNVAPGIYPGKENALNRIRIKTAPGPAMGIYFADSDEIHVELETLTLVYQARKPDNDHYDWYPTVYNGTIVDNPIWAYQAPQQPEWQGWGFTKFNNSDPTIPSLYGRASITAAEPNTGELATVQGIPGGVTDTQNIEPNDYRFNIWTTDKDRAQTLFRWHYWQDRDGNYYTAPGWRDQTEFNNNWVPRSS